MSKYVISNFTAGEVSPKALGRYDIQNYYASCRKIYNGVVLPQGGITKIPGTLYLGEAETTSATILIPWELSPTDGAILEVNSRGYRVWEDDEIKQSGGTDAEVDWPSGNAYADTDVQDIRHAVTLRRGFLTHPDYEMNIIGYAADTDSWSVAKASYVYTNNGGANSVVVNGDTGLDFATNTPKCVGIYDGRLILANTPNNAAEDWYFGSVVHGYISGSIDFSNDTTDAQYDEEAVARPLHAMRNQEILWVTGEKALLIGTNEAVWRAAGYEGTWGLDVFVPRNQGGVGSADVEAEIVDDLIVFVGRGSKSIHAVQYMQDQDKYVTNNLTFWAENVVRAGVQKIVYQHTPFTGLWAILTDGTCAFLSYSRANGIHAWSEIDIQGQVEDIAVIPGSTEDQVYFLVKREIDGSTSQYIEKLGQWDWDEVSDAVYVHSGVQLDGGDPFYLSSITAGDADTNDPVHVYCETDITSENLSDGDYVRFWDTGYSTLDGSVFYVDSADTSTDMFHLYYQDGSSPLYLSAGTDYSTDTTSEARCEVVYNTVSSLSHLEGEIVQALLDGGVSTKVEVSGGTAEMDEFANKISIGLPYTTVIEPSDVVDAAGYLKRIVSLWMKFYKTHGVTIGPDEDNQANVSFSENAFVFDSPPEMYTTDILSSFPGNFELSGKMRIEHPWPHPFTLLSMIAEVETGG